MTAIDDLIKCGFFCTVCGKIAEQYPDIKEHVRQFHNEIVTDSPRHKKAKELIAKEGPHP